MTQNVEPQKCPRCGSPYSWVEKHKRGEREYYVAVHYLGRIGGRKRVKKCYLGPVKYEYVSRLHQDLGLTFSGQIEEKRVLNYLEAFIYGIANIELETEIIEEIILKLEKLVERLKEHVRALRTIEETEAIE